VASTQLLPVLLANELPGLQLSDYLGLPPGCRTIPEKAWAFTR
jgi:hypothetical protein